MRRPQGMEGGVVTGLTSSSASVPQVRNTQVYSADPGRGSRAPCRIVATKWWLGSL